MKRLRKKYDFSWIGREHFTSEIVRPRDIVLYSDVDETDGGFESAGINLIVNASFLDDILELPRGSLDIGQQWAMRFCQLAEQFRDRQARNVAKSLKSLLQEQHPYKSKHFGIVIQIIEYFTNNFIHNFDIIDASEVDNLTKGGELAIVTGSFRSDGFQRLFKYVRVQYHGLKSQHISLRNFDFRWQMGFSRQYMYFGLESAMFSYEQSKFLQYGVLFFFWKKILIVYRGKQSLIDFDENESTVAMQRNIEKELNAKVRSIGGVFFRRLW